MKKSFQLSAVAIAIAASSSAIAGVSVNGSPSFGTINTTTVSINNLGTGNQVQTTMDGTGLTVDNKISTINLGNPGTPTSSNSIQLDLTGTPNTPVTKTGTVTQKLEGQLRTETTQVYDPNKVQFTSSDVKGDLTTSITNIEITGQYDANGVLDASSVSATSTPQALPANPFTVTDRNNQQELTLGRENTSEDYQLSISKTVGTDVTTTTVNAAGISTSQITLAGQDLATTIANGDAATLASANTYTDNQVAAEAAARVQGDADTLAAANTYTDNQIAVEAAARVQGDADTLAAANTYTDNQVAAEAAARVQGDADTLAAANTYTDGKVAAEKTARETADTAIRNDIATKVTTNSLEVNGPSNFNGPVTVNNVQSSVVNAQPTVAGKDIVVPTVNQNWANTTQTITSDRVDSQEQTRNETKQVYNKDLLQFSSAIVEGTLETTTSQTATATYDANGVIVPGSLQGPALGQPTQEFKEKSTSSIQEIALGRKDIQDDLGLSITKTAAGVTNTSSLTAAGISTTGSVTAKAVIVDGKNVADEFTRVDAAAAAEKNRVNGELAAATTDRAAIRTEFAAADTAIRSEAAIEKTRVNGEFAAATTDRAAIRTEFAAADTAIRSEAATEKTRVNGELAAATTDRAAIRTEFAAADTAIRSEAATEKTRVNGEFTRVDTAAAAETVRVNTALTTEATARSAGDAATLTAANNYTNVRANQLNTRIDDVQRTAYRGIAISLAAQQAVPSIGPGQVAIFGGVGHYEGETAGSIGVVTAFTDRLSASGAFGFAGGNEFGGRVGVAYVFGGK